MPLRAFSGHGSPHDLPSWEARHREPWNSARRRHQSRLVTAENQMELVEVRRRTLAARLALSLHPLEAHASAVRQSGCDIAAGKARLALRHSLLRAAKRVPPGGAVCRARQGSSDDRLDLLEAQHELRQTLLLQVVAQGVVVVVSVAARHFAGLSQGFG